MTLKVEWRGAEAIHKGYAYFGTQTREALRAEGVEITEPGGANFILACSTPTQVPPWYAGQKLALYTMFETDDLPPSFTEPLSSYDYLIVPNYHNQRVFKKHGFDTQVVYQGINPDHYFYTPKKPKRPGEPFRFLIVGEKKRKGIDLVIKAFKENFRGRNAELIIKGILPPEYGGTQITNITTKLSVEEMRELYQRADCVLAPSRGEGWGLPPLEGMACGTPAIIADNTGLHEFAHLGIPISCKSTRCNEYFIYGDAGYWYEPDYDELVEKMNWVFHNRDEANENARQSVHKILSQFTWQHTAKRLIELFGTEMAKEPHITAYDIKHPKLTKYTVTMKEDWLGVRICGVLHNFEAGKSYPVTADVQQIMENQEMI